MAAEERKRVRADMMMMMMSVCCDLVFLLVTCKSVKVFGFGFKMCIIIPIAMC